ncbi:MAG: NAD-dependent epimerase/dehydratase family protein [Vicinamibacterales bacterium]
MTVEPTAALASRLCLVTGATGFTGARLCRRLVALGARVRAIARPTAVRTPLADLPIEWVDGEVFDARVVKTATEDVEFVFHLAAAYRTAGKPDEYYRQVHVLSTKVLAEHVASRSTFERFVHVSTVGVHGHIEKPPADENAPFDPGDIYQATKAEAEQWLHAFARERNLPYTVVRPCAIYGPGDRRLFKLFQMAARGVFVAIGSHDTLYHLIHVDDLVEVICLAAVHPAASGQAFIAGNRRALPLSELMTIIGDGLARRVRVLRVPLAPVWALATACEALCRPFGVEPPLYRRRVAFYTKDRSFDTSKLRERLGFTPRFTEEQGLRATAAWYLQEGWLR